MVPQRLDWLPEDIGFELAIPLADSYLHDHINWEEFPLRPELTMKNTVAGALLPYC